MISVVDDDVWAREGLRDLIAAIGYEVRTFESAEEFVTSGSIAETACLITDLNMPGMSGSSYKCTCAVRVTRRRLSS